MRKTPSGWRDRLSNVPIPEQHALPLVAAVVAERFLRFRLPVPAGPSRIGGAVLLIAAASLAARAWREARDVRLADPERLVTTGPYARSRHPMYRAWALGHLGWALFTRSGWALALWLPAVRAVRREVGEEEDALRRRFGAEYERYAEVVRR